jgi:hypothetical protein
MRVGGWDPSLAFVMGSALLVGIPYVQSQQLYKKSKALEAWGQRPVDR